MSLFFNDLENSVKGILEDGYVFSKRFNLKSFNSSGLMWAVSGDLSSFGTDGSMSMSFQDYAGLSLDKLRFKSNGRILGEASFVVTENIKLVACIEDGRVEPGRPLHSFGKIGFDYTAAMGAEKGNNIAAQLDVDVVNGPSVQGACLFAAPLFRVGGEFLCNTHLEDRHKQPELVDINIGGSVHGPDWIASLRTTNFMGVIKLGYSCTLSPQVDLGAVIKYRIMHNDQHLHIGGLWRPDQYTEVRSRVDSDAIVATSFKQKITPELSLTMCSEVDAKEFGLGSHKFGIGVDFEY